MSDSPKKRPKPSLESLLADSQVLTGKEDIEKLKEKAIQAEEFAKAAEFEERNQSKRLKG
jgi:hypothetical protein